MVPKGAGTEQALKNYVMNGKTVTICIYPWVHVTCGSDACQDQSLAAVANGEEELMVPAWLGQILCFKEMTAASFGP